MEDLPVCSWRSAQHLEIWLCDFPPNALHTSVKRLCLSCFWLITWLGWPCNLQDSFTRLSALYRAVSVWLYLSWWLSCLNHFALGQLMVISSKICLNYLYYWAHNSLRGHLSLPPFLHCFVPLPLHFPRPFPVLWAQSSQGVDSCLQLSEWVEAVVDCTYFSMRDTIVRDTIVTISILIRRWICCSVTSPLPICWF